MLPLLTSLLPIIGNVLDRVIPDSAGNARARLEIEKALVDAAAKGQIAQAEINRIDAQSANWFQSCWRPAVGWCCSLAFVAHYLLFPLANWIGKLNGVDVPLPDLDMDSLLYVLGALLGIGTLRTVEKARGLTK